MEPGQRVVHKETGALGTVQTVRKHGASVFWDEWTMPGGKHTLPAQMIDARLKDLQVAPEEIPHASAGQ